MKRNLLTTSLSLALSAVLLAGCGAKAPAEQAGKSGAQSENGPVVMMTGSGPEGMRMDASVATETEAGDVYYPWEASTESYEKAPENGFFLTQTAPLSTFSASVDTASYTNVRRMIEDGYRLADIPASAVRAEEFINYFHYDLNAPAPGEPFGITVEMAACPWNPAHDLLFIGLQTEAIDMSERPASNLVFLIDVSGSMDEPNKLPLLIKSFQTLTEELTENDTVSIVTYAGSTQTVLRNVSGAEKDTIRDAFDSLLAGGSTNGEGGIQRAYELAEDGFIEGGINRVILATDGDFNIGVSDPDALERLIGAKRDSGIYLSVLGFGMGNYKDDNMERLSRCGNGNYAYIDSLLEAKRVLVEEMGATLVTVADDVKLQIEFHPSRVNAYRLVGYENRMLSDADFANDEKDAAEVGAGHSVVVLYEIIPADSNEAIGLRYGTSPAPEDDPLSSEYAFLKIRYKAPGESTSKEIAHVIDETVYTDTPGENLVFASCAAEFAMLLSGSSHAGTASFEGILETCRTLDLDDDYKNEFFYLVRRVAGKG